MALKEDLEREVADIFRSQWSTRDGRVVPDPDDLALGNDGVDLDATVLYADMAGSTALVDGYKPHFAAEIYKAFLTCSAKIIKDNGGVITAYDGDRVMAVYIGDTKNTNAMRTALKINHAMLYIIRPKLKAQYSKDTYVPGHSVGIDTSKIRVARIGVRNDNDLVWVGRAANHAAKLSGIRDGDYRSWITADVYNAALQPIKIWSDGRSMWEKRLWTAMGNKEIYRSSWWVAI
jgi:class 3 adenylate cyclase